MKIMDTIQQNLHIQNAFSIENNNNRALKKKQRIKNLKLISEKIKIKLKEKYKNCNLFVKNLPENFKEVDLINLFSKFGKIRSARLIMNETKLSTFLSLRLPRNRGVGFVCFEEELSASKCKYELNNSIIYPDEIRLYVNFHQNKKERAEFLKMNFLNYSKNFLTNNCILNSQINKVLTPIYNKPDLSSYQMSIIEKTILGNKPRRLPNEKFPPYFNEVISTTKKDENMEFYGDQLYMKIVSSSKFKFYSRLFPKIIGIFLELEETDLNRLLSDLDFFEMHVTETIKLLIDKEIQSI